MRELPCGYCQREFARAAPPFDPTLLSDVPARFHGRDPVRARTEARLPNVISRDSDVNTGAAGQKVGAYTLLELIGRGGMGEVWRARHDLLQRLAAIKLIRP